MRNISSCMWHYNKLTMTYLERLNKTNTSPENSICTSPQVILGQLFWLFRQHLYDHKALCFLHLIISRKAEIWKYTLDNRSTYIILIYYNLSVFIAITLRFFIDTTACAKRKNTSVYNCLSITILSSFGI